MVRGSKGRGLCYWSLIVTRYIPQTCGINTTLVYQAMCSPFYAAKPVEIPFEILTACVTLHWVSIRGSPLEYWGWSFVGKMGEISKWPQGMGEINILSTKEFEINII